MAFSFKPYFGFLLVESSFFIVDEKREFVAVYSSFVRVEGYVDAFPRLRLDCAFLVFYFEAEPGVGLLRVFGVGGGDRLGVVEGEVVRGVRGNDGVERLDRARAVGKGVQQVGRCGVG